MSARLAPSAASARSRKLTGEIPALPRFNTTFSIAEFRAHADCVWLALFTRKQLQRESPLQLLARLVEMHAFGVADGFAGHTTAKFGFQVLAVCLGHDPSVMTLK